ncbi:MULTISPECIES: chaperone NapD [Enterovibrio]|uniref:Chaperone NapD n=1 Tax=Enterovibrio norvegicus TaxID=188144 RepID=A0A2N7L4R4_9GAMM|nr:MULTISPECIES: chaperone NapD [Enterovibrio]MBE1274545.1 nitrate reductase [Enterovibrio baiacu]MCC4797145.1 chaperone NapD [Enterovibrio norvegicus]OEE50246.1 nitrate reductase [Enterovibrio norvegicus]PMH64001.1 nitrate reductase [Enterovibrio norvegicus]PMI31725.1 nitrate reductase [Enterovibrio norvegicus]
MSEEYHVSSLVVHAAADQTEQVKERIEALPGTEVPATNQTGKLVVVVEGDSRGELLDIFEQIKALPGVLAATLVFHQVENENIEPESNLEGVRL